jgi:O-antigen/teichoic acid export membrane protein
MYTTVRVLTNSCLRFVEMITISVWPEITAAFARADLARTRELHRVGNQWAFWSSLLMFSMLLFLGPWIYTVWVGEKVEWNWSFFALMTAAALVESVQSFTKVLPMSTNRHSRLAWRIVVLGCIYLATVIPLTHSLGIIGPPLALIAHNLAMSIMVIAAARHLLRFSVSEYLKDSMGSRAVFDTVKTVFRKMRHSDG